MPTEVLVMCTRCGRPQAAARQGNCMACGEALPEAPLPTPASPEAPFLLLDGGNGRIVAGADRRLVYRADASAPPVVVELGNLQAVVLGRRRILGPLLLVPLAWALTFAAPSLRPFAAVLAGLGLLTTLLLQRYVLVLKTLDGKRIRWPLGLAWFASGRAKRLGAAWSSAAQALASRGVSVSDEPRSPGPGA